MIFDLKSEQGKQNSKTTERLKTHRQLIDESFASLRYIWFFLQVKAEPAPSSKAKSAPASSTTPSAPRDASAVLSSIVAQGDAVRQLKTDKAPKEQVDAAVKQLLALKSEFKQLTGQEYKPGITLPTSAPVQKSSAPTLAAAPGPASTGCPFTRVSEQGELVRKLKAEKAPKVSFSGCYLISCQLCSLHSLMQAKCLVFEPFAILINLLKWSATFRMLY